MASLNGVTIYPSNIERELVDSGEMLEAADNTSTLISRGLKYRWTLTWNDVGVSVRNQVRAIALLTSTFTFVDEDGVSYTALRELQPYSASISTISSDGTLYYTVTLKIRQE